MNPRRGSTKQIVFIEEKEVHGIVNGLDRSQTSARGRPSVTAHTEGSSLSTCKANARVMLKEKRSTTLTQFLVTGLVTKGVKEADSAPVRQKVKETHKLAVEAARCDIIKGRKALLWLWK